MGKNFAIQVTTDGLVANQIVKVENTNTSRTIVGSSVDFTGMTIDATGDYVFTANGEMPLHSMG